MLTAPLFFAINESFDVTINGQLRELAALRVWDKTLKQYFYIFPVSKLHQVTNLTRPLAFSEHELLEVLAHTSQDFESSEIENWKGKSGYTFIEYTNFYRVISYQKSEKAAKPSKHKKDIPKSRVVDVWSLIAQLPQNEYVLYKYLAPKVCKHFALERYFREKSGSFDGAKFQGTRLPGDYGKFYYYPLKVLEALGLVHRRGQMIARIKESWEQQTTLSSVGVLEEFA